MAIIIWCSHDRLVKHMKYSLCQNIFGQQVINQNKGSTWDVCVASVTSGVTRYFFDRKAYWSCVHDLSIVEGKFKKCHLCIEVIPKRKSLMLVKKKCVGSSSSRNLSLSSFFCHWNRNMKFREISCTCQFQITVLTRMLLDSLYFLKSFVCFMLSLWFFASRLRTFSICGVTFIFGLRRTR